MDENATTYSTCDENTIAQLYSNDDNDGDDDDVVNNADDAVATMNIRIPNDETLFDSINDDDGRVRMMNDDSQPFHYDDDVQQGDGR